MEHKLFVLIPWSWVLIIYQTKDTFQDFGTKGIYSFRLMEWDVYWKQDKGSEFYTDCLAISTSESNWKYCLLDDTLKFSSVL